MMDTALLRLFNAVLVKDKKDHEFDPYAVARTVRNGYLLHPSIKPTKKLMGTIEKVVGISGEKANASFHKSWAVVRDSSMEDLVLQQILHYITTYGYEAVGVYSQDTVYIPNEVLEVPDIARMPLTVVKALTSYEVLDAVVELGSGIALAQETLDDVMTIVEGSKFSTDFVAKIKNRELKALLYDFYGICPSEPVEYLRYVVSKLTDESLLIKNRTLIEKLKEANGKFLDELLKSAPKDLASIFLRFKPIFLALKSVSRNKTFFNRLRKQAVTMHKPLPEDYLNSVTSQIKNKKLDLSVLQKKLTGASVFRKVRLAYALNFRLNAPEAIVYRVRNGRGWASEFEWASGLSTVTRDAVVTVVDSIADDLRPGLGGKVVYIPENVHYTIPATEKQFTGNFPTGSYVSVAEDLIVGIHWTNVGSHRVDLDLSMLSVGGKIGWNGSYRTAGGEILFSGDVTDARAPKGASELFYIKKGLSGSHILSLNYYNYSEDVPVPAKIIVAQEKAKNFKDNYMVDPNNIVASANIDVSKVQMSLGLIAQVDGENRVYFSAAAIGKSIASSFDINAERSRKYYLSSLVNSLSLRDVLVKAGAEVVTEKPEEDYLDLSPEALDKTTITRILKPSQKEVVLA